MIASRIHQQEGRKGGKKPSQVYACVSVCMGLRACMRACGTELLGEGSLQRQGAKQEGGGRFSKKGYVRSE